MNVPLTNAASASQAAPAQGKGLELRSILVPVDFSPASRGGLEFAGALARRLQARLDLVHVVEPPSLPEWGYAHIPRREARLRRATEERLPGFPLECGVDPQLVHSTLIRSGAADYEIVQTAAQTGADLIVIASRGLGHFAVSLLGGTAERVVRRATCPVLVVHPGGQAAGTPPTAFSLSRLLVTIDFSQASKKALPYAVALAREFDAALLLLHVVPAHLPAELSQLGVVLEENRLLAEAREGLSRLRQAELDPELRVDTLAVSGAPAHAICRAAEAHAADLIVMATHGHTGLKHFLLGSVTENVVRHAGCPVLVVREREREFVSLA